MHSGMVCLALASCPSAYTQKRVGVTRAPRFRRTVFRSPVSRLPGSRLEKWDHALFCASSEASTAVSEIRELTAADYYSYLREEAGEDLVVVDFYTKWCAPCKVMYPELLIMQQQYRDKGVRFVKLDCNEQNKELGKSLKIRVAPTFFLYRNGEVIASMTGAKVDALRKLIGENLL